MISCRFSHVVAAAVLGAAFAALIVGGVAAQSGGDMKINRWTLTAASGGSFTSTNFSAHATMAQPVLGVAVAGERYGSGGIWSMHHINPWPIILNMPEIDISDGADPFPDPAGQTPGWSQGMGDTDYFPDSSTFVCPTIPPVVSLTFPDTLDLPAMPTLELMTYISSTYSPIISLTESIAGWRTVIELSKLLPEEIADAMGITGAPWEEGNVPDLNALEFGGYTASEMANELVSGIDMSLSYIRGLSSIGIIGPTAAGLMIGLAWIALLAALKLLLGGIMLVVRFLVRLWELLPFT